MRSAFAVVADRMDLESKHGFACMLWDEFTDGAGKVCVIVYHCVGVDLANLGPPKGEPLCDECAALPQREPVASPAPVVSTSLRRRALRQTGQAWADTKPDKRGPIRLAEPEPAPRTRRRLYADPVSVGAPVVLVDDGNSERGWT